MLGVQERGQQTLGDLLTHYLRDKALLLVLDNFEQVLGAAPVVADLLGVAPRLTVLVTSRAPLRVRGEHEYAVPPFAVPDPQHLPALAMLTQYDAVRLFIARAQEVRRRLCGHERECTSGGGDLCTAGRAAACDRTRRCARAALSATGAAGPAWESPDAAYRRGARPASAPADAARRDRLEL